MAVWNILRSFGIFHGHLVLLWQSGIFSPVLVHCVNKNLATLLGRSASLAKILKGRFSFKMNRSTIMFRLECFQSHDFALKFNSSESSSRGGCQSCRPVPPPPPGLPDCPWYEIPKRENIPK
jgi:hypothetical protein